MKKATKLTKVKAKVTTPRKPRVKKAKTEEVNEKPSFSFNLFLWWTFKIVTLPLYMVYLLLFKIPNEPAKIIGFIRVFVFLYIINYGWTVFDTQREYLEFTNNYLYLNDFFSNLLIVTIGIISMFGFFVSSLMVATGFHMGVQNDSNYNYEGRGYNNIKEAFEFRDGVLGQQTTREKMEEMAKTGFASQLNFNNPLSNNEIEAFEYLDGQLGMCSTNGKYEKLKELYSKR